MNIPEIAIGKGAELGSYGFLHDHILLNSTDFWADNDKNCLSLKEYFSPYKVYEASNENLVFFQCLHKSIITEINEHGKMLEWKYYSVKYELKINTELQELKVKHSSHEDSFQQC